MNEELIASIADKVRRKLADAEGGHDWWHIARVRNNARIIASKEGKVDHLIIELAALLHDIADAKFHDGNEDIGPDLARSILFNQGVSDAVIDHVVNIIKHISFKNSLEPTAWSSRELQIVQDADRLDAIGAVGIARAFSYGGYKQRSLFDPETPPLSNMTKTQYKKNQGPTINHFYEKLLKLKDMMHTNTAKQMASERHDFMLCFLETFYTEAGHVPPWHQLK